jgi:acetyl esterase/lipase
MRRHSHHSNPFVYMKITQNRPKEPSDARLRSRLGALLALALGLSHLSAQVPVSGPQIKVYKTVAEEKLTAHVFRPEGDGTVRIRPAIVLFHGGGFVAGSPEWVYDSAKRYASFGAVAVAVEYRLSSKDNLITPIEALEDARDAVRWMRQNALNLGIDTNHIAAFGVSAGGHLAASLAFFGTADIGEASAVPNALVLISPAVAIAHDAYFQGLLGKRALGREYSPDEQMNRAPPPTIVFSGAVDNLATLDGVARYCDLAKRHGGECTLYVYQGVGHLFTRKQPFDPQNFDPDPKAMADATEKGDAFLAQSGFLPYWHASSAALTK